MIRSLATALTLALLALPVAAQDDTVASASEVNGSVQVNTGERFVPLQQGRPLKQGDRVMAMNASSATIAFDDGCTLKVEPETMIVVPDKSTCAGGIVTAQAIAPGSSEAVGTAASGAVDWKGFWTVASVVLVGNAILFNEDETVSP